MPKQPKYFIYLASQSRRRRDLLKEAGIPFQRVPSSFREGPHKKMTPSQLVRYHALGKANAARPPKKIGALPELILGSDTVVVFQKKILGKPKNLKAAETMLKTLSGKVHWVYSGIALIHRQSGKSRVSHIRSKVRFRKLSDREIRQYVRRINPLDKAGGYAIQREPRIVAYYEGSLSNIIGLPVAQLKQMIRKSLFKGPRPRHHRVTPGSA